MQRKADLHSHTYYSDGINSPHDLVTRAKSLGISILAVTDHDNVDAIDEAISTGKQLGVEIVPGVEISAEHNEREVHILAYFLDYKNEELQKYLKGFRVERVKRAEKIVEKLNTMEVPITMGDVMKNVKGNASVGRPHIAFAMIEKKFVSSYIEAFNKYIGDNKPAYVKKPNISASGAVNLISSCGGLSFVAHPGRNFRDDALMQLIETGLDGIEVVHPSHNESDSAYFREIAGQYFLLESGGSDYHGGRDHDENTMGKYFISEQKVQAMKDRLFIS